MNPLVPLLAVALLEVGVATARPMNIFPWYMSGDRFVTQVYGEVGVESGHQSLQSVYDQRYAEGYQAGVVDATQGLLWCAPPGMKPPEVDDRIWGPLKKRAGTMPGNAASEMVKLYAARFPCPEKR